MSYDTAIGRVREARLMLDEARAAIPASDKTRRGQVKVAAADLARLQERLRESAERQDGIRRA